MLNAVIIVVALLLAGYMAFSKRLATSAKSNRVLMVSASGGAVVVEQINRPTAWRDVRLFLEEIRASQLNLSYQTR